MHMLCKYDFVRFIVDLFVGPFNCLNFSLELCVCECVRVCVCSCARAGMSACVFVSFSLFYFFFFFSRYSSFLLCL